MKKKFVVPDEFMVPLGAKITQETKQCADSWSDSIIAYYRNFLPFAYQFVPLDALRIRWTNIRKRGTEGYKTNGHGPGKGSRKQA